MSVDPGERAPLWFLAIFFGVLGVLGFVAGVLFGAVVFG